MAEIIRIPSGRLVVPEVFIFGAGQGKKGFGRGCLEIEDGKIVRVTSDVAPGGYKGEKDRAPGWDGKILEGYFLVPGFIDSHIHLALNAKSFEDARGEWYGGNLEEFIKARLTSLYNCGIAAVRDGGDSVRAGLDGRSMVREGSPGPEVVACGPPLFRRGRYGAFLGRPLDSLEEFPGIVSELARQGIDQLKIMASGLVSINEFGKVGLVQWTVAELSAMVKVAASHGLKVMAHASSSEAVKVAARAGVHSVEHGYFLTRDDLMLMAEKGTTWVPTVAPMANLVLANSGTRITSEQAGVIEATFRNHMLNISLAFEMGLKVAIGTDAGAPEVRHGYSFAQELQYYLDSGVPAQDVLYAATAAGAQVLGVKSLGSLEQGKKSHFLAFAKDPVANTALLPEPRYIVVPDDLIGGGNSGFGRKLF